MEFAKLEFLIQSTVCAKNIYYAIIIGNNAPPLVTSTDENLAKLEYSDDDAVRFYQFFNMFTDNITLLSHLDLETQKQYPEVTSVAKLPYMSELKRAVKKYKQMMLKDIENDNNPIFYLTFSGHGAQNKNGMAFLSLLDGGELTQKVLYKEILKDLPATNGHLFIDACYAGAVIGSRGIFDSEVDGIPVKVSPETKAKIDLTEKLENYPKIGVILATTSEQKAHEWSKIRSGVFTHELLSALTGSADVNGDGKIEYTEVQAFIASANRGIKDPRAIPKVIAYPPSVNIHTPIVALSWFDMAGFISGNPAVLNHFYIELDNGQRYMDAYLNNDYDTIIALPAGNKAFILAGEKEAAVDIKKGETLSFNKIKLTNKKEKSRGSIEVSFEKGFFETPYNSTYYKGYVDSLGISSISFKENKINTSLKKRSWHKNKNLSKTTYALAGLSLAGTLSSVYLAYKSKENFENTTLQRESRQEKANFEKYTTIAVSTGLSTIILAAAGQWFWPDSNEVKVGVSSDLYNKSDMVVMTIDW